jgi:RNA polymerase sigma factor (sigma-70 family)
VVTTDLITRARAGDGDAFRELTEPLRPELSVHCYRVLGSIQDAEDALQDTLLSAWQALDGFEGRASIRTWLYRIATNRCLDVLRSVKRRPAKEWDIATIDPPEPTRRGEITWLEPYPDTLLQGAANAPLRERRGVLDVRGAVDLSQSAPPPWYRTTPAILWCIAAFGRVGPRC